MQVEKAITILMLRTGQPRSLCTRAIEECGTVEKAIEWIVAHGNKIGNWVYRSKEEADKIKKSI